MKTLVSTRNMPIEDWLEWRRKGIGGSDAPAIMGVNPYSSAFEVWFEKTNEVEYEDNEAMYWGRSIEDILARRWMEDTGKRLHNRNAIFQHPEYYWMLANIDRIVVGEDAGWEGKTTNAFYEDTGECPMMYWVQCQHYLAVLGKAHWYVSVLAGGQKYYEYVVERDDDYINDELIPAEHAVWESVLTGEMPEVDGSDACTQLLNNMYPKGGEKEILLPDETLHLIDAFEQLSAEEKAIKAKKDKIGNELKIYMQDNARGYVGDRKVYWTDVTSNRFDGKAFQSDNPELYQQYMKESSYRRFQVK